MNRLVALPVLTLLALVVLSAAAEEPPHLQFVHGLREKQLPDLALQYLDLLAKKKLPPELTKLLPLERAKVNLDLAALETDAGKRLALQRQARAEFDAFLKANPNHPLTAEVHAEIGRAVALGAKAQLGRARRQEVPEAVRGELLQARAQFEDAGKLLRAAVAAIDVQLAADNASEKPALAQAKLQTELEIGINLLDQAQTYVQQSEFGKRGEIIKQALTVLDKVVNQDDKNAVCWLARVWRGKCYQEADDPKTARKAYTEVLRETGDFAEAARRLALYFQMQVIARDPDVKNPASSFADVERLGDNWLIAYRNYQNTPEGFGVRYELASACVERAQKLPKSQPAQARALYLKAQKLYQALEQSENDYTETARQKKMGIVLMLSEERTRGDVTKLRDFEECYLRAQYEAAKLNRAEKELKDDKDKLEKQRDENYRNMIAALTRGLDLADSKVTAADLHDARYLLARAYFAKEDYYRAAVVGEDLARTAPQATRAPSAGMFAIYAYAQLIDDEGRASAGAEILDADRARLRKLAEYVEQTWPADPAADVARHQLGLVLWNGKKYPEAVEALTRITPGYANAGRSSYLLAAAALQAQKAEIKPPAGAPPYAQRARAALQAVPEPAAGADAGTAQVYLEAKLQLGGLLYTNKSYAQVAAVADVLQKKLDDPSLRLPEPMKTELLPRVKALQLLALLGQADADYRAGQYAKVREQLDPLVDQLKKPETAALLNDLKNPGLLHGLLGLALRANVQENKTDRAKEILDLLQKSAPENSLDMMKDIVRQLGQHIQELRQRGDAAKEQLDKTITNFSTFLDELAGNKELKPELVLFLADSYSSLDRHQQAAQLLARVGEPGPEADGKVDPKKVQIYRAARILYARALRQDRQFAKAKQVIDEMLGTPAKPGWGQPYLDVKKERIFLLEDQEKYTGPNGALAEWNRLMQSLQARFKQDARVKEQYFECYYYLTNALYRHAQTITDRAKRQKQLQLAADFIVKLEATQPDMGGEASKKRFEELLQKEPVLKEQYEAQKQKK